MQKAINKVGAGDVIWLVVLRDNGKPIEGGAHTSEERAVGTVKQLEADYPEEAGRYEVVGVEIEW